MWGRGGGVPGQCSVETPLNNLNNDQNVPACGFGGCVWGRGGGGSQDNALLKPL